MKLTAKILILLTLILAILTAAVGWYSARQEWAMLMEEHQDTAKAIADQYRESIISSWKQSGDAGVVEVVHGIEHHSEFFTVKWQWFHDSETQLSMGEAASIAIPKIKRGEMHTVVRAMDAESKRVFTYVPIIQNQDEHGGLEVSDTTNRADRRINLVWWKSLLTIIGMFVVSMLFAGLAGFRMIAMPLQRIMRKTEQVAQGDFSQPIEVKSKDELGQLANSLNDMSSRLSEQREQIKQESEQKLAALSQLRHSDRLQSVGQLSSGVAHELGTPLNVVLGNADLIASGKLPAEEVVESANAIKSEVSRMSGIVRNLLDFSRQKPGEKSKVCLGEILRATVELLHNMARKASTNILLDIDEASTIAVGDHEQLKQVFMNLIVNAIHAMPDGGNVNVSVAKISRENVSPKIQNTANEYYCVKVADQGVGIEPEAFERIFEPFFTTKEVGQGTGLGLSIAFGIIREHGGWIDVDSAPGQGSCFSIYLPVPDQI